MKRLEQRRLRWTVCLVLVAGASVACSGDDYPELVRGQCLPEEAEVVGVREEYPPTVSCDEPHRYQVYGVGTLEGRGEFPGDEAVDAESRNVCFELFEANVGYPPEEMDPDTKVVYLQPSRSSWISFDDRDVECLLIHESDRTVSALDASENPTR